MAIKVFSFEENTSHDTSDFCDTVLDSSGKAKIYQLLQRLIPDRKVLIFRSDKSPLFAFIAEVFQMVFVLGLETIKRTRFE